MALVNRFSGDVFLPCLYAFNVRHQRSSALTWAAQYNQIGLANRMLKEHRGHANTPDYRSRTPIFHAIQIESEEMIRTLLESGADLNWQDDQKQTPLLYALQRGHLSVVRMLLRYFNPSVDCEDDKGRKAIWYAVANGDEIWYDCSWNSKATYGSQTTERPHLSTWRFLKRIYLSPNCCFVISSSFIASAGGREW